MHSGHKSQGQSGIAGRALETGHRPRARPGGLDIPRDLGQEDRIQRRTECGAGPGLIVELGNECHRHTVQYVFNMNQY